MNQETNWLSSDERKAWIGLMTVFNTLPAALDRQLKVDAGITHFDYQIMVILAEEPNRTLCMSQLSAVTSGSLPRLSQAARRLQKSGLLERNPDPNDGRTTLVTLTALGGEVLESAAPSHVAEVRRLMFDHLNETQVANLTEVMDHILTSTEIGPDHRPAHARP